MSVSQLNNKYEEIMDQLSMKSFIDQDRSNNGGEIIAPPEYESKYLLLRGSRLHNQLNKEEIIKEKLLRKSQYFTNTEAFGSGSG